MGKQRNRRDVLKGIASTSIGVSLAGCGGDSSASTDSGDDSGGGSTSSGNGESGSSKFEQAGDTVDVGMVYSTGGLGDNSFNDMAHKGVKAAKEQHPLTYTNAEPESPSQFKSFQRRFASSSSPNYDLVTTIGFAQKSALSAVAPQFPKQRFTIIDSAVDEPNVESYLFKEQEGSFQCGLLAGLLTTRDFSAGAGKTNPEKNVIGFVGGKEVPLIKTFQAGYLAGAKQANSDVTVKSAYAGAWNDPAKGQSIAESMFNAGADIVYHAAGGTGVGVIKAAQSQGRFAIGVDAPQSKTLPEYADAILGSMVKFVDEAVLRSATHVANGKFSGGQNVNLGLKEDGVGLKYGTELGGAIPSDVKNQIESASKTVIDGERSVPTKVSNV
ncbi:MAG: BMP family protein [Haloarcula sp.]